MIKTVQLASAVLVASAFVSSAFAQSKADDDRAASAPARAASTGMPGHMYKPMHRHCQEMQKIIQIKDAKKRQKAFDAHMQAMHDEAGCDMMKDGMGGGMGK